MNGMAARRDTPAADRRHVLVAPTPPQHLGAERSPSRVPAGAEAAR